MILTPEEREQIRQGRAQILRDLKYREQRLYGIIIFIYAVSCIYGFNLIHNNFMKDFFGWFDAILMSVYLIILVLSIMAIRVAKFNLDMEKTFLYNYSIDPDEFNKGFMEYCEDDKKS